LVATVKDSGGNPVSGATVTFTAPGSGASAAFSSGSSATALTDATGVATAPILTANGTTGSYTVTASTSGLSGASFALTNVTPSSGGPVTLVQHTKYNSGISVPSVTLGFNAANTAGNWIGVVVYGGQGSSHLFTVTDSNGNTYRRALTQGNPLADATLGIYYAENIKAGPNTIKVQPDSAGYIRLSILEYSGIAATSSLDVTASAQNTPGTPNSGSVSTTANGDLLLGAEITGDASSIVAGPGYTIEDEVPLPGTRLTVEVQVQPAAGPTSATITSSNNEGWAMGLAAFKKAP
jgi:hypothetical protein